ncbi:MAG: TMEM165/GDT1 family protein [Anaerolineales bacterium]|nr:MAG: TMEM165/GDT1 family protein [Anaerolineales bacterium]
MDWKTILSTFGLIFLAELGDKTQLACIGLTCKARSPLAVFLGAVGALAVVTLIGVIFGEALTNLVPTVYIRKASGILFMVIGAAILISG